ncbi:MAG TPA: heavy metal-binding domain-containing protein, partial [Aestuariivirgaceae bacterium]|nr:heavy metal-binding domain-containing protein [Aestuariivirgaceae bacterium]
MATDPVCGMQVNERTAAGSSVFEGRSYYFCSTGCKKKFDTNPSAYVGTPPGAGGAKHSGHARHDTHATPESQGNVVAVPAGAIYTCPMHPEIVRNAPGSCPKCGMALVPVAGTGVSDDTELRDLARRLWIG